MNYINFFSLINHMKNVWVFKLKLKTFMKKNWRIKDNWYRKYLKKLNLENQKKLIRIDNTNVEIYEISEETRG